MNTPNPLVPQGSLPSGGKTFIAFFTIIGFHVVLFGGLLFVGCSKDTPPSSGTDEFTNSPPAAVEMTNAPVAGIPENEAPQAIDPNAIPGTSAPPAQAAQAAQAPLPVATASPLPPPVPVPTAPFGNEYTVASGDILGSIARKNGVTLKALLEANPGVDPKKLKIGQKLQIPAATAPTTAPAASASEGSAAEGAIYVVKSGDMLEPIARKNGTTVKAIVALNGLKSANSIKPGQKLKMPAPKSAAVQVAQPVSAAPAAPMSSFPAATPAATPGVPAATAN